MQLVDRESLSPEQRPSQGPRRFLLGVDPGPAAFAEGSASGEALRMAITLSPPPPDEGAQLGLAEGRPPLVVGYFFFPPRAP